jgi:hypothetical protein
MDTCGFFGGIPRLPLLPLKEQEREGLRVVIEDLVQND